MTRTSGTNGVEASDFDLAALADDAGNAPTARVSSAIVSSSNTITSTGPLFALITSALHHPPPK
jgi:hypothetical protein